MQTMYYIGLDVHKRTISDCVKDGSGKIRAEGSRTNETMARKGTVRLLVKVRVFLVSF
jgi:hypothetical protein